MKTIKLSDDDLNTVLDALEYKIIDLHAVDEFEQAAPYQRVYEKIDSQIEEE